MPAVLGNDPRKHRWGKENVKQEKGGGNSGCVDEQVTTAEDHRKMRKLYLSINSHASLVKDYSQQVC